MRSTGNSAPFLAVAWIVLGATCSLASCGLDGRPRTVVALDEAFAAARPTLAARLQDGSLFGDGPAGLLRRPIVVPVALSEGAGKALDAAMSDSTGKGEATVLIASPLIAKAIMSSGTWDGIPPLLVPEWRGGAPSGTTTPGLWTVTTDPVPAYGAAGAAAGAFIAALSGEGGSPACGILFSEAPSRPRAALASFAEAYADASEGGPLYVRDLGQEGAADSRGGASPPKATEARTANGAAQAAVAELLGYDIRVLFVALGSASGAAIEAAARPSLAIGADFPAPGPPISLAFRIYPDDIAIAAALAGRREAALGRERGAGPGGASGSGAMDIPAILAAGPVAGSIRAGRHDFAYFLSEALRRRLSGPRRRIGEGRVARERFGAKTLAAEAF
jgi:hypothetical protein